MVCISIFLITVIALLKRSVPTYIQTALLHNVPNTLNIFVYVRKRQFCITTCLVPQTLHKTKNDGDDEDDEAAR